MGERFGERSVFSDPDATRADLIEWAGGASLLADLGSEDAVLKELGIDPATFDEAYEHVEQGVNDA